MTRTACNALLFALLLPLGCSEDSEGTGGTAVRVAPVATRRARPSALSTEHPYSPTRRSSIVFDRSMNPSSLQLGGSMAADSDGGAWSTTSVANDTLTIAADPRWDASAPGTLTIEASDLDGNALSTLSLTYAIRIRAVDLPACLRRHRSDRLQRKPRESRRRRHRQYLRFAVQHGLPSRDALRFRLFELAHPGLQRHSHHQRSERGLRARTA